MKPSRKKSVSVSLEQTEAELSDLLEIYIDDYLNTHFFHDPVRRYREVKNILSKRNPSETDEENTHRVIGYIETQKSASKKQILGMIEEKFKQIADIQKAHDLEIKRIKRHVKRSSNN